MQGRDAWLALQRHLAAARAAAASGDREVALAAVNAALEIDPEFLAAQTLRDRLLKNDSATSLEEPAASPAVADTAAPPAPESPAPALPHDVSPESYAKFQLRAKQRRVETRVEAARDAIRGRRLSDAAAALDEVIELEPRHPELAALTTEFDALRRRTATWHRGPWAAAAAAFIATTLGASYVQDSSWLASRPLIATGVLIPAAERNLLAATEMPAVGTSGEIPGIAASDPEAVVAVDRQPAVDAVPAMPAAAPARIAEPSEPIALNLPAPQLPAPATQPPLALPQAPAYLPPPIAIAPPPPPVRQEPVRQEPVRREPLIDDSALVRNTLQQYRRAYEDLDAQSAQSVWPTVNEPALARAFNGLESQTLTFDACNVRVTGDAATATCRGSARYVPKVGSRDPRIEPRVWNFTLKKNGGSWMIDSARAER